MSEAGIFCWNSVFRATNERNLQGKTVDKFSYCMVLTTYTVMYRYRIMEWKYSKFGREVRHSSIFNIFFGYDMHNFF
jgi:hypothetical protein